MIDYILIGKRIRFYRQQMGLTQESLAFDINTSAAYVSCIERGKKKPSLQKLVEIAESLNISVNDLLFGTYQAEDFIGNLEGLDSKHHDIEHTRLLLNLAELVSALNLNGRH